MEISICMMVKDEEKNITRCLDSIKPILENIDSELIIVDTGSKDKTVEIAKEYTNKIFFHKWENDFSGMRNKSISYAKGEWILIIDADEEIVNCNNIIEFFKLHKDKPFKTGLLNVKNLHNLSDDSQYAMLKSPRLFRNDGSFRYEGIVHNNPIFKEPTIDLETTIIHYGYIEENEEVLNKKFIRTSTLLKKALEKEPENIYYRFQLSVTYSSYNDYFEGYETIKKAYKLLEKCKDKGRYKYVYYQMALCALKLEEDELAKRACEEGLRLDEQYIDLMFYLGKAKGLLGEYEECIQTYKKYMKLCDDYNNMNINFDVTLGMYTLGQKDEALQDMVKIYFKIGNFDEVLKFASQIEKDKYIENVLELIIRGAISLKNIKYIKNFYEKKFMGDKIKENKFFVILEKYSNEKNVYELFSIYNNDYSKLYLLRHKYNKKDSSLQGVIDNIMFEGDFNKLEDYFGDIIYYKLKYCSYIPKLSTNIWDKNINKYLVYISEKYEDFSEIVVKYISCFKDDVNYENLRINKILCRYVLLIDKVDDSEYEWIFKYYLDIGIKLITYIYNDDLIEAEYINTFNNEEEKFLVYMNIAMKNEKYNKNYIKYIRKAVDIYPYMKNGIKILMKEIKEKVENYDNNEFESYKLKFKENINNLIGEGKLEEAEKLINEYEKIVKQDLDIYSMKTVICIMDDRIDEAETILKEGLRIDPQSKDLLYNLSYIMSRKSNNTKAVELYSRAELFSTYGNVKVGDIISNLNPINKSKLRVIHGTMEIANQMYTVTKGLKKLGVNAKTLNYYPNYLGYKADYTLNINSFKDTKEANIETKILAAKMIAENDVFHFYFGTSLTLDYSDFPLLKQLGKKVIMQYLGSDVRMYSKAIKLNKYAKAKNTNEDYIKRKLELISKYVPDCLVDYELAEYVKDYHLNIHYTRAAIDLKKYKFIRQTYNKKFKIVHAPTSPEIKGTNYILKAIEELKEKYDFEFELVQGMSHEQATQIYEKADLIIDQILIGAHGLFAVESMAMGKPVICWISDFMKEKYPKELPIISANPDNIKEKIEYIIKNKDMLKEIGIKGRMYAEKYHDMNKISKNMLEIYKKI